MRALVFVAFLTTTVLCSGCDTKSLILRQVEQQQLKKMTEKEGLAGEILDATGDTPLVGSDDEDMESSLSLVHNALREGDVEKAEERLRPFLAEQPIHPQILVTAIIVTEKMGENDYEGGIALEQQAARLAKRMEGEGYITPFIEYWEIRNDELQVRERIEKEWIHNAVQLIGANAFNREMPENESRSTVLETYVAERKCEADFLVRYAELLKKSPDLVPCLVRVGRYGARTGEYEIAHKAILHYLDILSADSNGDGLSWGDRAELVSLLAVVDTPAKAIKSLSRLQALAPEEAQQKFRRHVEFSTLLCEKTKGFETAKAFHKLGAEHANAGRFEDAQAAFDTALQLSSEDARDLAYIQNEINETKQFWACQGAKPHKRIPSCRGRHVTTK